MKRLTNFNFFSSLISSIAHLPPHLLVHISHSLPVLQAQHVPFLPRQIALHDFEPSHIEGLHVERGERDSILNSNGSRFGNIGEVSRSDGGENRSVVQLNAPTVESFECPEDASLDRYPTLLSCLEHSLDSFRIKSVIVIFTRQTPVIQIQTRTV